MNPVLSFFFLSPLRRLYQFLVHWYWDGGKFALRLLFRLLESFDSFFAVRESFFNLASPLYQDYSLVGYAVGIPTRLFLVVAGSIVYLTLSLLCLLLFIIWSLLPPLALLGALNPEIIPNLIVTQNLEIFYFEFV